jgi:hypothetical protein
MNPATPEVDSPQKKRVTPEGSRSDGGRCKEAATYQFIEPAVLLIIAFNNRMDIFFNNPIKGGLG